MKINELIIVAFLFLVASTSQPCPPAAFCVVAANLGVILLVKGQSSFLLGTKQPAYLTSQ